MFYIFLAAYGIISVILGYVLAHYPFLRKSWLFPASDGADVALIMLFWPVIILSRPVIIFIQKNWREPEDLPESQTKDTKDPKIGPYR